MNKFYVLIVVMIFSVAQGFSQTWTGTVGDGKWNTGGNWSGGVAPNSNLSDVVFNLDAEAEVETNVTVRSITVTGGRNVRIKGTAFQDLNVISGNLTAPSITVSSGNTLRFYNVWVKLADNIIATIAGTLTLEGNDENDFAIIELPSAELLPAQFNISGTVNDDFGGGLLAPREDYLNFNAGSILNLNGPNPTIPKADYNAGSSINIKGSISNDITFDEVDAVGGITYNPSSQSADVLLNIKSGITIGGELKVQNTGGHTLTLLNNQHPSGGTNYSFTVNGAVSITGTSDVALASSDDNANTYSATFNSSFTMSGSSFSLQNTHGVTNPTTLFVKGNINHTAGDITAVSNSVASSVSLFNIEMNGGSAQQITAPNPHAFHNTNNQLALRISNPNGVTLSRALEVDALGFSGGGKLITTPTNYITVVNNTTDAFVISGTGFVDGPVRRITGSTGEYVFPTGDGTTQRYVSVYPNSATATTYQASYSNNNTNTAVHPALTDVVGYNWEVDRIGSGASAQVELTLPGPIGTAGSGDAIVVAKSSDDSPWQPVAFPGSFVLGSAAVQGNKIKSEVQTSFSSFTIAWGPMSATLPINLLSFTASKSAKTAKLNWKVSGNSTPAAFDVMKSSDGANFNKIGSVTGMEGKLSYDFTDDNLTAGNNYYRLKMLDKDGTISYSNIIVVMNGNEGTVINSMMPTMVADRARLSISSSTKGNLQLVITDMNGRIVQTQVAQITAGNQEVWVNATRLSTGIFHITGYINGEKTVTIRFFKQ